MNNFDKIRNEIIDLVNEFGGDNAQLYLLNKLEIYLNRAIGFGDFLGWDKRSYVEHDLSHCVNITLELLELDNSSEIFIIWNDFLESPSSELGATIIDLIKNWTFERIGC